MIVIVINVEDQYVNRIQQQILAIKDSELGIHEVVWGYFIFVRFALRTSLTLNLIKSCFEEKYGGANLSSPVYDRTNFIREVHYKIGTRLYIENAD
jgi:hypothetical protein